jgi:hypothetical protein
VPILLSAAQPGRASGTRFAPVTDMITQRTVDRLPLSNQSRAIATLLQRIRSEYREMPGLKLTEAQARRLWNLDDPTCRLVLSTLQDERFLKRTPRGTYVRGVWSSAD